MAKNIETSVLQMGISQEVSTPKLRIRSLRLFYLPAQHILEKLAGSQLVKEFPAFYGTQRFTTAFTRVRHPPRQLLTFRNKAFFFTAKSCWHLAQSPSRTTTSRRLSATAYSIYSQRPSILQADPRSAA